MLTRTLERMKIVGSVKDQRDNSLLIPVCREHQAETLQSLLGNKIRDKFLVDLMVSITAVNRNQLTVHVSFQRS